QRAQYAPAQGQIRRHAVGEEQKPIADRQLAKRTPHGPIDDRFFGVAPTSERDAETRRNRDAVVTNDAHSAVETHVVIGIPVEHHPERAMTEDPTAPVRRSLGAGCEVVEVVNEYAETNAGAEGEVGDADDLAVAREH